MTAIILKRISHFWLSLFICMFIFQSVQFSIFLSASYCLFHSVNDLHWNQLHCILSTHNSIQKNRTKRIRYNEIAESVSSSTHHQYCLVSTRENRVIKLNNNMTIDWNSVCVEFVSMFYPFLEPLCVVQQVSEHFEILRDIHQYYW